MAQTWRDGRFGPAGWYLLAVAGVFGVRAITTLVGGATWGLPGTGWRSVWQLLVVAVALAGLVAHRRIVGAVAVIGAVYALASVLELADGGVLVGAIPVDMRDRLVHPAVALLAVAVLAAALASRRRRALPA
jgi:hypothetical protein